jgi:hypothetical protein
VPRVWLSLGSNLERESSLRGAIGALRRQYGELVLSPVYETPAVGFAGEPFLNLVVGCQNGGVRGGPDWPACAPSRMRRDGSGAPISSRPELWISIC